MSVTKSAYDFPTVLNSVPFIVILLPAVCPVARIALESPNVTD